MPTGLGVVTGLVRTTTQIVYFKSENLTDYKVHTKTINFFCEQISLRKVTTVGSIVYVNLHVENTTAELGCCTQN